MTIIDTTRAWLRMVGAEHNIHPDEVHHVRRVDDFTRTPMDYVEFRFTSSVKESDSIDNSDVDGVDLDVQIIQPWVRRLTVSAVSENGMEFLESLYPSIKHPDVLDIFRQGRDHNGNADDASRLIIVDAGEIVDQTTWDDSNIDYRYTAVFTVRKHAEFAVTRTYHIAGDVAMTGKIIVDDEQDVDITVTVT